MSVPAQRSFAGGEIAPALYARTDQVKYETGLRACRNMLVRRHGGASNRSGSKFTQESKNSAITCRLIRFVRDATAITDTYLIELGNGYARFYQAGAAIVTSGVSAWANVTAYTVGDLVTRLGVTYYCISAHTSATATDRPGDGSAWQTRWYAQTGTIYEIPTPYATADLPDLQYSQKGNVITIVHPSYESRELTRVTSTRWTLAAINFGPSIAAPTNVVATGGSAGTIRYWAVTAIKENTFEESLAGLYSRIDRVPSAAAPTALVWDSVAHSISYNVYRSSDGQTYGLINSAGGAPVAATDTSWADTDETASGSVVDVWAAAAGQLRNALAAISATIRAYDGKYTVKLAYTLVGSGDGSGSLTAGTTYGRFSVYYSRNGEARVLAGTSGLFSVEGVATVGPIATQLTIDVPDNGYATLQIDVVPEVLPAGNATATMNVNTASAPNNVITWLGGVTGFSDVGTAEDTSIAPPVSPTLFLAGAYPGATTNFQQRRFFGHTTPDPDTVYGSRIGSRASFTKSTPLQDDDMVQFALEGDSVQAVKHLMDLGRLTIFTTAGVFQCGSADDGSITPTTPNPREIDGQGIGRIPPLKVSDSALFVEGRGTIVRDLQPWQAGGALGGYTGKDLTVFAAHLFDGYTIVDWAYAKTPNSIIWAVRSDGVLLGLTYLREHAVWGWHRHDTDGLFENVCVIPEGTEDAVYVVVKRTLNGITKRYIERFASRATTAAVDAFFVDAGVTFDGRNTSVITLALTGGTAWDHTELLTVTAVGGTPFAAGNVGDSVLFTAADGSRIELRLEAYVSTSVMRGHATRAIPAELQATATTTWTLAVAKLSGLAHLEGKAVSVLGDGFVDASPNNAAYPTRTVSGGLLTLGRAYGVVHVGLPFISDLETLDYDSPGPRSNKDKKRLVTNVGVFIEASRGIWAGISAKVTAALPLAGLQEKKPRATENYDVPPAAATGYFDIPIDNSWDNNGGVFVRQVDPLPMTILAVMPGGFPQGG